MPEISPELADKVLAADLRNLIKKVGEGDNLSPAQRDMIRAEQAATLTEADLSRARVGSLLIKWAKGSPLSKDEKGEISGHLPSALSAMRASTRESYKETMLHYAEVYACSDRSIKGWIKEGREVAAGPDLPPLDDPPKMAAWYSRVKQRRVPSHLLSLQSATPVAGSGAAASAPPPAGAAASPPAYTADGDFSYDLAVQFAAENLQHAQNQLRLARADTTNTGNVETAERSVARALSEYRKAKNDEGDNLKRSGGMVDRRIMLDKMRTRLAAVHQGVRSCPVRAGTKLALPPDIVRQITRAMNEELDALFKQLQDDSWAYKERLTLEAA